MRVGDLVLYYNSDRIPLPLLGIILQEKFLDLQELNLIAVDHRLFSVLLNNGSEKIIPDSYLRHLNEVE